MKKLLAAVTLLPLLMLAASPAVAQPEGVEKQKGKAAEQIERVRPEKKDKSKKAKKYKDKINDDVDMEDDADERAEEMREEAEERAEEMREQAGEDAEDGMRGQENAATRGNEKSQEMRERRDERKQIMDEYKGERGDEGDVDMDDDGEDEADGAAKKGKKPWWKFWGD